MVWPPQSPDLSVLESVWDYMKREKQMRRGAFSRDAWKNLFAKYLEKSVCPQEPGIVFKADHGTFFFFLHTTLCKKKSITWRLFTSDFWESHWYDCLCFTTIHCHSSLPSFVTNTTYWSSFLHLFIDLYILPQSTYFSFFFLTPATHPPLFPNLLPSLHLPACVTAVSTSRRTRPTAQHPSFCANKTACHAGQWPLLQPTMPTPEPQSGPTGRGRGGKESEGGRQRGGLQACMPSLDCSLDHGCLWGNWTPAYAHALTACGHTGCTYTYTCTERKLKKD